MDMDYKDLRERIEAAADRLEALEAAAGSVEDEGGTGVAVAEPPTISPESLGILTIGLRASLLLADAALGECQKATPYSPMHPVLEEGSDSVRWCCNHSPQHCG
jgi:hypothetical protein